MKEDVKLTLYKDIYNYLEVKYNFDLNYEIIGYQLNLSIDYPEIKKANSSIIINKMIKKNHYIINARFIYWIMGIANNYYNLNMNYNDCVGLIAKEWDRRKERIIYKFRWRHYIQSAYRCKQKFVKNNVKLKNNSKDTIRKDYNNYKKIYKDKRKSYYKRRDIYSYKRENKIELINIVNKQNEINYGN